MKTRLDKVIEKDLQRATYYDETLKDKIWENLEEELFRRENLKEEALESTRSKKKRVKFKKIVSIGIAAALGVIGITVMAEPIRNRLKEYFGSTKVQDIYDQQSDTFIRKEAVLYESELGYMTFYDQDYFQIERSGNKERFIPKEKDPETYVEIELIRDKDYSTLFKEITGNSENKSENSSGVEEIQSNIYKKANEGKTADIWVSTSLCDAKENGVFKITIHSRGGEDIGARSCYYIKNQFIVLNAKKVASIEQGKPQLYFEYDTHQYELLQYRTMQDTLYLQEIGTDFSNKEDMLIAYRHYVDQDSQQLAEEELRQTNERVKELQIEKDKALEQGNEDNVKQITRMIQPCEEVPNDLKVPAKKVEWYNAYTNIKIFTYYYIDDQQGGAYEIIIYRPDSEEARELLNTIKIVKSDEVIMQYKEVFDESKG